MASRRSGQHPKLVQRLLQVGGVSVDAKRTRAGQLVLAVTPAQEPDAQHASSPGGEQVPDCVADHIAVLCPDPEPLLAGEEEVWLGLGAAHFSSLDDHRLGADAQDLEGGVDLRSAAGGCDPMYDASSAKVLQEVHRARQGSGLGKELAVEFPVSPLEDFGLLWSDFAPELPGGGAGEQPPLIPIRRWIFHPSMLIPASLKASCQAKTWA
jgi:hypothetical protein